MTRRRAEAITDRRNPASLSHHGTVVPLQITFHANLLGNSKSPAERRRRGGGIFAALIFSLHRRPGINCVVKG
jgi:hypothetical protein